MSDDARMIQGDCCDVLPGIADASVDAVICDPPYPEIDRPYGRMTEAEWHAMMRVVVPECRRILKPHGSAVFVLQPNSERVGRMRLWLWEFMVWAGREWGIVQDAYWWNTSAMVLGGANSHGLMRPSLKYDVWLGPADCYRDQSAVLISESASNKRDRASEDFDRGALPSRTRSETEGPRDDYKRLRTACVERGGVTPFNLLPMGSSSPTSGGTHGHGAATPFNLCDWWVRYISPPGGVVCDPFMGSGTVGLAALARGRSFVGIERDPGYFATAERRISEGLRPVSRYDPPKPRVPLSGQGTLFGV